MRKKAREGNSTGAQDKEPLPIMPIPCQKRKQRKTFSVKA
jgi:hypothetical protein